MQNADIVGKRVDLAVMDLRSDLSRRSIKKLIIEGLIKVNGETVMANYKMKDGDEIEIDERDAKQFLKSADGGLTIKPNKKIKFGLIYEDENIIVVDKPEGVHSHPVRMHDKDSLLNGIYHHISVQQKYPRDDRIRLVHRLDKDTSGVVMATKNLEAHDHYTKQFENRKTEKTYFAIVKGDFPKYLEKKEQEFITFRSYIGEDADTPKAYKNTDEKHGKLAITKIYFEKYFNKFGKKKFSLLKVNPETGRTHQIRVHLSKLGFPIMGDRLYGGQKYKRMMLHAAKLRIIEFRTGKWLEFEAELPEKFED